MNDPNEVERLRARVAELETQLATAPARPAPRPAGARRSRWWAVSSAVLLVLACVLAPVSVASVWAKTTISDTNRYVETVAPLAQDPGVQTAVANAVTTTIFDNLDVQGITTDALNTLAAQPRVPPRVAQALPGLAVPITNGVESFTRTQVNNLVRSPRFAAAWTNVNRIAHTQVVKLLEGNQGGAVSAQGNTITLNLGPIIAQVKQRLVARGFSLASKIPVINKSFVLVQSDAVTKAQNGYRLLNTLGVWLPFVVLALFIGGVALARERRRALLKGALGITGAMLVLGVGLALARWWYVDNTPGNILTPAAAGSVFDTLVRFLRTSLRALAVLGLVVGLGAFMAGPSTAAVRSRSFLQHGIGSARGSAEAAGWNTGRFGTWTYAHKRLLQTATLVVAGLVLVFWNRPTGVVVVVTAVVELVVLAIIEFLGRPPAPQPSAAHAGTAPPAVPPTVPRQVSRAPEEEAAPHATTVHGSDKP